MQALTTQYDPVRGALALGTFSQAAGSSAAIGGRNLREGLLQSLVSAELMAAAAGLVPWFQLPGGQRGVATIGAAREKLSDAPEGVRVIYLAAHGAARSAQAHARTSQGGERIDGALAALQNLPALPVQIGDFGVTAIVLTVMGVAAICATAWFAKGTVEKLVQTHADDLRASYAADTAAKIAAAQIAAGQPVSPETWSILGDVAKREASDGWVAPAILGVGGLAAVGGLGYAAWQKWGAHG